MDEVELRLVAAVDNGRVVVAMKASTAAMGEEPAMLASRKTSPERSTPGPLPSRRRRRRPFALAAHLGLLRPHTAWRRLFVEPRWKRCWRVEKVPGAPRISSRPPISEPIYPDEAGLVEAARRSRSRCMTAGESSPACRHEHAVLDRSNLSSSVTCLSAPWVSAIGRSSVRRFTDDRRTESIQISAVPCFAPTHVRRADMISQARST